MNKKALFLIIITTLALSLAIISSASAFETSLPEGVSTFNNHYYFYYADGKNWYDADAVCKSLGGHLVTISTLEENEFVSQLKGDNDIWIGGYLDENGLYQWTNDEHFLYENWSSGEPNHGSGIQDHAQMYASGKWDDEEGSYVKGFVCEWDYSCASERGYFEAHKIITKRTPATCTERGELIEMCEYCEQILTNQELLPLGHEYDGWRNVSGSVLIPPVVREHVCARCNYTATESRITIWSILAFSGFALAIVIGLVNYIRMLGKKKKTK